jgi:quercetin dioxygenase-like cupin family protein
MLRNLLPVLMAFAVGAHAEDAKAPPQAERKILAKHDQSGVPGKEIVIGTANFPPGAVIGFHTHPGDEAGYLIKGSVTLKTRGGVDKVLKAGDSILNLRGAVHSVVAGPDGAVVAAVWIVDKDVPMTTPTP